MYVNNLNNSLTQTCTVIDKVNAQDKACIREHLILEDTF